MVQDLLVEKANAAARSSLANFRALLEVCGREIFCLSGDNLDGLAVIVEEKESLIKKIQDASEQEAPIWDRVIGQTGEDPKIGELGGLLEEIRKLVEEVQSAESRIAELLSQRAGEVRNSLGSLSHAGKAVDAYAPVRSFAPRFIDRKE